MADGRLAKDVQSLRRHIEEHSKGQAKVTDVDDTLEFVHLDIMPRDGYYRGAKLRFKVRIVEFDRFSLSLFQVFRISTCADSSVPATHSCAQHIYLRSLCSLNIPRPPFD